MVSFTAEDKCLIKFFRLEKVWNLECLANGARISVEKLENTLNDFIRKLDKTDSSRPGSPERSAHDLSIADQAGSDEQSD